MPYYYTSDATQLPFSAIFNGAGEGWPFWVRLIFAFRKATGLHYSAAHAQSAPEEWRGVDTGDLPASARKSLEGAIAEIEPHGFELFGTTRSDTIGLQISYNSVLISEDRATICTITALRTGLATMSSSVLITGLRSDLTDGTILITGRGPKLPSYLIRPPQKIEMIPESSHAAELVQRHRDRLRCFPAQQVVLVPTEGVADYLLKSAKGDWKDFMATGMLRRLSAREVARLREIQLDFE